MKTKLESAIDHIYAGTITREADAMLMCEARIEALEWLVEVLDIYMKMYALDSDHVTELDSYAYDEIIASYIAARAAAGV